VAFEQTSEVGGTWVYRDEIGKDKYGLDIHSSMYQGLHTNLPKELMHYPDYPFPDAPSSYVSASEVLKYYQSYAENFNLNKFIKFEHHVLRVRPVRANNSADEMWEVIVKDLQHDKIETHLFEAILVCNGHYNSPHIPDYVNRGNFKVKEG
jgi:cation diffusion facilitator CzcD-associated flavoprotein CzcO